MAKWKFASWKFKPWKFAPGRFSGSGASEPTVDGHVGIGVKSFAIPIGVAGTFVRESSVFLSRTYVKDGSIVLSGTYANAGSFRLASTYASDWKIGGPSVFTG